MSEKKCKYCGGEIGYIGMPYGFTCLNRNCITHNDKEFIQELKQQLQTAKEENEKLKGRNEHLETVHEVDTHFCTAFINLKEGLSKILHHYYFTRGKYNLESMCLIPAIQTLVGRLRGKVDKQEKEIELLTQQNKQMRGNINNIKNLCNEDWEDMTVDKFQNQLLQALNKGVE